MFRSCLIRTLTIIVVIPLLIYLNCKFSIVDFLLFPGSIKTWHLDRSTQVIAISPNGKMLAVPTGKLISRKFDLKIMTTEIKDSTGIEIRSIPDGKVLKVIDFFAPRSLAFSPDSSSIAAGTYVGEIKIWRVKDGQILNSLNEPRDFWLQTKDLAFIREGNILLSFSSGNSSDSFFKIWDVAKGKKIYTVICNYAGSSPDGKLLFLSGGLSSAENKKPIVYRLIDRTPLIQLKTTQDSFNPIRFSPDGKLLALTTSYSPMDSDKSIYIYSTESGKLLHNLFARTGFSLATEAIYDFNFSPDSNYLAVSYGTLKPPLFSVPLTSHGHIRLWRIKDEKQIQTLRGHEGGTDKVMFMPDGKQLVSIGSDRNIRFWKFPPQYPLLLWLLGGTLIIFGYRNRFYLFNLLNNFFLTHLSI